MSFPSEKLIDLLISGYHNNKGAIKFELHHGANPNFLHPTSGISAIHLASGQGEEPTLLMLQFGGDPNIVSFDGSTSLHVAASWGHITTLKLLLKYGADISVKDQDGKTAYDLAVEEENECALHLKHISVNQAGNNCRTYRHVDQKKNMIVGTKSCHQNSTCYHEQNNHLACHVDNSANECEISSPPHLNTITEMIYKHMGEGRQVYFDATSPDTPVLVIKPQGAAYTDSHCCVQQEHLHKDVHCRSHMLQCTGGSNIITSPVSSSSSYRGKCRGCIQEYSSCCNDVTSIETRTEVNSRPVSHRHHKYQVFESEKCDQLLCAEMSSNSVNMHCQSINSAKPTTFCERYEIPSSSGFCNCYNTTTVSPNQKCSSHFVTPSLSNFKSASLLCRDKTSVTSRSDLCKDYKQLSTDIQSPGKTCVGISGIKSQIHDLENKSPILHSLKNPHNSHIISQCRRNTGISSDSQNQNDLQYLNKCILPPETKSEACRRVLDKGSSTKRNCKYDEQSMEDRVQNNFSPKFIIANLSSKNTTESTVSDSFYADTSRLLETSRKMSKDKIVATHGEDVDKSDKISQLVLPSGKLFPPLLTGCIETSCIGRNKSSVLELKNDFQTTIKSNKKSKRKSFLRPPDTVELPPKLLINPREKVAAFILSVQNYMSQCSLEEDSNDILAGRFSPLATGLEDSVQFSDYQEEMSMFHTKQNIVKQPSIPVEKTHASFNASTSSIDTFATCDEGYSDAMTNVNEVEKELKTDEINSTKESKDAAKLTAVVSSVEKTMTGASSSKWKSPFQVHLEDDIMTSDDSYIHKTSPRVYRMKIKPKCNKNSERTRTRPKDKQDPLVPTKQMSSEEIVKTDNQFETFPVRKRLSSDSLFSILSVKEYVYRDKEANITLIERHIPSECGSSIMRRSLNSTSSIETIDSQATVIYDWRAFNEVLKAEQLKVQPHSLKVSGNRHYKKELWPPAHYDISCLQKPVSNLLNTNCDELSSENSQQHNESLTDDDENNHDVIIPAHLERMTCQEISQELQKYGEIPGPVIPATRQTYLRHLTTLGSNPGLVILSNTRPEYPGEMRQALDGQFNASGLAELESEMIEVFSSSKNNCSWREGTAKSSFTYLLLDPRITDNLPLRSKNMTDLEVFKTFICSIFYIGKGKRSRPYCHLYDAVSKMNKVNVKMSAKEKQIVDIWNAGLGVVSLHCFQSVIPVEAYTREACMIQAIGVCKLTNMKQGDFYGAPSSWTVAKRRKLGVYLLKKALQIFLAEGERQICLPDLK